jgi:hypothetical protein
MCEKAKGFYFDGTVIYQHEYNEEININIKKMSSLWFLLLQRAIEGVNRENGAYRIEQAYNMIEVLDSEEYDVISVYEFPSEFSIDKAKEAALKYIFEQEKNNEK